MNLRGICVCVNYSDLLARSLGHWHTGLDRLVIVTAPADHATRDLCAHHNVETHVTDIFYANGARFNKGAALSEAVHAKEFRRHADWLMTFDADIVPPVTWRIDLEKAQLQRGSLYGARRYWVPENSQLLLVDPAHKMPQSWVIGFFSVFHSSDPRLPTGPLFDLHWPHGGIYDTTFARRWPMPDHKILPIPMIHLGEERTNWMGRDDKARADLREVLSKRRGYEDWEKERMKNPPKIKGI